MRRRTFLAGAGAALVAAGCGLPDDDRPRRISAADAPRDLVPTTAVQRGTGRDRVDLYFVDTRTGRLQAVPVQVPTATSEAVIQALLHGPGEDAGSLTSSIPPDTELNDTHLEGNLLVVDLGPADGGIVGVDAAFQLQAFAQLVYTATNLPDVAAVRFTVAGNPLSALTDTGAAVDRPVDRNDYRSLDPDREPR